MTSTSSNSLPESNSAPNVLVLNDDVEGDYIDIRCGSLDGKFFYTRLKDSTGNLGAIKCILVNKVWYTPCEFETKGGKAKAKYWKKSISHQGKQLLLVLPHLCANWTGASNVPSRSTFLRNPILAFVKAHRLRGDNDTLRSFLLEKFDYLSLSSALRELWEFCRPDLERIGFLYQARRSTDTVFSDLISAFVKLDLDNSLPDIFCEASDLLLLPSLELDPVSKQIDSNTKAIDSLRDSINELPAACSQPAVDLVKSNFDSINSLVVAAEKIMDKLSSSLKTAVKDFTSIGTLAKKQPVGSLLGHPPLPKKVAVSQSDRSANIIVFGLPESISLDEMKKDVDDMLLFVTGKSVPWSDAFRLGRRVSSDTETMTRRPLLIKLCSVWDKRLVLAAKSKLKAYSVPKVFLREDLPLDVRRARAKNRQKDTNDHTAPLHSPIHSPSGSPRRRHSPSPVRSRSGSHTRMYSPSFDSGSGSSDM